MSRVKKMSMAAVITAATAALGVAGAPLANAAGPLNFGTALSGANEVPTNASTATGTATVILSADESTMTVSVTYSNLTSPSTAAHIHTAPAGMTGPPTFPLDGATGTTSGSFGLENASVTPSQVADLRAGIWYVNVHSTAYPDGEIRGQLAVLTCLGRVVTQVGTNGADTITGTAAADVIAGLGGDDVISGLTGRDVICGGLGNDTLFGGKAHDVLAGEEGDDRLVGGKASDKLIGGDGNDTGIGGPGRDKFKGVESKTQ
jgi:Ca2+-binding RTX toxin-like protein